MWRMGGVEVIQSELEVREEIIGIEGVPHIQRESRI